MICGVNNKIMLPFRASVVAGLLGKMSSLHISKENNPKVNDPMKNSNKIFGYNIIIQFLPVFLNHIMQCVLQEAMDGTS